MDSSSEDDEIIRVEFSRNREEINKNLSAIRTENTNQFTNFQETVLKRFHEAENAQGTNFEKFSKEQREKFVDFETKQENISKFIFDNLNRINETSGKKMAEVLDQNSKNAAGMREELQKFMESTSNKLAEIRNNVEISIKELQKNNFEQLEKIRTTVEEKLDNTFEKFSKEQKEKFMEFATKQNDTSKVISDNQARINETLDAKMSDMFKLNDTNTQNMRTDIQKLINNTDTKLNEMRSGVEANIKMLLINNSEQLEKIRTSVEEKLSLTFESFSKEQRQKFKDFETSQSETSKFIFNNLNTINKTFDGKMSETLKQNNTNTQNMRADIQKFMNNTEQKLDKIRTNVDDNLKSLQTKNTEQIEKMRETVDEKLQKTLETRLSQSFKQVSERLESVQKGLGEMQTLTNGVGDLKKVLSNVKTKGVLGEYQLENILEEILTPAQYEKNINTIPSSNDRVEFAVKMPGKDDNDKVVYLPIDAKFPTEDYQILLDAYDEGNQGKIIQSKGALEQKIKKFAKDIRTKYVEPPHTTDFAVMFLPFEGLYVEVLRINGLFEYLQKTERIIITGPTTIAALLNSLQIGFQTLAIQKRTSEVRQVLGAVKNEFGKFAVVLENTKKKIDSASKEIDKAGVRTRAIERTLRDVEALPEGETLLSLESGASEVFEVESN